jgi:signal transduction histidine kinase
MALDFYSVLVVDDNPGEAELAGERLHEAPGCNFEVRNATSLAEALAAIAAAPPDAVILDLNLPDSQGLDTLREVRRAAPGTSLIVVSGMVDDTLRAQALRDGAEDVLSKDEAGGRLFCRSVLYVIERQRARLQHRQLEQLLDATPDAMLAVNARGEVRFVNSAALTLLGRTREELMREHLVLSVDDRTSMEVTLPSPSGPRVCEMRVVGMEWNGEHTRLASIRDVTERKQAEALRQRSAELERQNERIREASELKSTFVAHMGHEIRTPMNAVIGLTHLLGQSVLDDDQRQMIAQLQSAGSTLMGLLNNVLDLSKIEAGQVALEDLPFEVGPLVEDVAMLFASQARQKGLAMSAEVAPEVPRWIRGDPTRLRQILTNLVGKIGRAHV